MTEAKSFPLPSDLKVVPGTEGAQAAYPYYTQFVPEDDQKFWFYNSMHFPEPMHHFDMITAAATAPISTTFLVRAPSYIDHMKPSMIAAITQPITSEAIARLRLNRTWFVL